MKQKTEVKNQLIQRKRKAVEKKKSRSVCCSYAKKVCVNGSSFMRSDRRKTNNIGW